MKKICRAKLSEDSEIIFKSCEEMDYFETEKIIFGNGMILERIDSTERWDRIDRLLFDLMIRYLVEDNDKVYSEIPLDEFMKIVGMEDREIAEYFACKMIDNLSDLANYNVKDKGVYAGFIRLWGGSAYVDNDTIYFNFNKSFHRDLLEKSKRYKEEE
jgi:hypothetical protein